MDMFDAGCTLKVDGKEEHFLLHETKEEDDNRTSIYHGTEMDGAIQYGNPDKIPPLWLQGVMNKEMKYLNELMLLTGEAARAAIATADACTKSRFENRKVALSEIIGK